MSSLGNSKRVERGKRKEKEKGARKRKKGPGSFC